MTPIDHDTTMFDNIPDDATTTPTQTIASPPHDDIPFTLCSLRASPVTTPSLASPMLTTDQLKDIISSILTTIKPQPKEENPLALARLEHYISQGLTLKFDGAQDNLIPWIK
jgi:hypothetical protein